MGRLALWAGLLVTAYGVGCSSAGSPEERSFSVFAQRVQRQLEVATNPSAVDRNALSTRELVRNVDELQSNRARLQEKVNNDASGDHTRERIEIVRIDRQLQMIDRLLTRYEQNAPAVASGD